MPFKDKDSRTLTLVNLNPGQFDKLDLSGRCMKLHIFYPCDVTADLFDIHLL